MRKHLCLIALSLLAAAFAGCSSADKDPTVRVEKRDPTQALAKYNRATVSHDDAHSLTVRFIETAKPIA